MLNDSIKFNMPLSGVMWKTVSESCNLACDYCYYSRCNGRPGKINRIDDGTLEKFIAEYMGMKPGYVPFSWQGGEPLLAGLDFFEKVVDLQVKYAKPRTMIANSIQSNGTLIDKEWARFFKKYQFLVGISLDGPEEINDKHRVTGSGTGSFSSIMRGVEYLKEENIEFNILTVIHEGNVTKGKELMEFYLSQGFPYVQFIPCMDFQSQNVDQPGSYAITPKQYGDFLCDAFDVWYNNGCPKISVRFFDNMLSVYVNQQAEMCQHSEYCPKYLILEQNGDAYPCDFFMDERFKLGNIRDDSLEDLLQNENWDRFLAIKLALPEKCRSCEFLHLCHGGCPRNRVKENNEFGVEYFCDSYKQFYRFADKRMSELARTVKKRLLVGS